MPLRKSTNGGWERVTFQQLHQEEEREHDETQPPEPIQSENTTVVAGGVTQNPTQNEKNQYSSWASEGIRRVRADKVRRKMYWLTGMAAIGGFLFGYDTGVISGATPPIQRTFGLTPVQVEIVVSSTVFTAFLSSLMGSSLTNKFGRRSSILFAAAVFALGSFVLMLAFNYWSLVLGRIIVGVGIGIASLTTPVYIAEVAVPRVRGQLVTVNTFLITLGQFGAGMVDGLFDQLMPNTGGWRYMLGLAAVPALLMFYGFIWLPDSPRWLASQGRYDEAVKVLKDYRESDEEAYNELREIKESLGVYEDSSDQHEQLESKFIGDLGHGISLVQENQGNFSARFMNMIKDAPTCRALYLGCGLMLIQQCSGINTVMYYAASIYEMSEFDEITSVWLSGFTALAQVLGIALSIYFVDKTGRRTLVLTSLALVTISLIGLGFSFYLARVTSEKVTYGEESRTKMCMSQPAIVWDGYTAYCYDCAQIDGCGFCGGLCTRGTEQGPFDSKVCPVGVDWTYHNCSNRYGWLSVFFMVAYLLSFGIGMGGMPWTIASEIFPLRHRSIAVSFTTGTNWMANLIIAATFLSLSSPAVLTAYGAFWLYGGVAFSGFVWMFFTLPETKGLSLEEIERLFQHGSDGYDIVGVDYEDDDERLHPQQVDNVSLNRLAKEAMSPTQHAEIGESGA